MGNLCSSISKADASSGDQALEKKASASEKKNLLRVFEKPTGNIEDEYELGKVLGQPGQYGRAQLCKEKKTGKEYAVKVMNLQRFRGSGKASKVFDNFRNEFLMMQKLDHPNIIKAKGAYETETDLYFVMDLCTGGELFDQISARKTFSEKDAQQVLRQIMEGLLHMHEKKIAHCDLKPDNFLYLDDSYESIKIIDFGFAKYTDVDNYLNNIAGTCFYMAPEVLEQSYSIHADIWSMGVVMYILLFGYPPFNSKAQGPEMYKEIKSKIRKGFDPSTRDGYGPWFPTNKPVTDSAKDLISKMLVLDSAARLSAREVLDHPWMTGKTASEEPLTYLVKAIGDFYGKYSLKKKLLGCLSAALTEEELMEVEAAFKKLDLDGNGFVTLGELKAATEKDEKHQVGLTKIKSMLERADMDEDGQLSYQELVMAATHKKLIDKEERLKIVFVQLDQDGSKKLSKDEIMKVLQTDESEADAMIKEVDADGDGMINYDEFLEMWRGKQKTAGHSNEEIQKQLSQYE